MVAKRAADRIPSGKLERWRADPASFITSVLYDPETNQPFELLDSERNFLKFAFRLNAAGRLLFPEQVYACPKKSGKTGFGGMHMLTTVLLFGGAFGEGFALANDLEQAASRVFLAIKRIVEASPLLRNEAIITVNKITFPSFRNATITAITSDYASAAGANPSISVFDESWAYTSERSRRLFDEMIPPPTRKIAARLTVSYAGFSGESTMLEELYKRGLAQPEVGPSLHAGDGLLMFWSHTPVAPWQTEAWLAEMRRSLRPNQYLRMIENRFVTTETNFIDMEWWDRCVDPDAAPRFSDRAMPVWVGVDASVKRDSTAIVVVTFDRQTNRVVLVEHYIFQPTAKEPLNFEATIERTLRELIHRYAVRGVHFDPYQMASVAQRLQAAGVPMREYPQTTGNLTEIGSCLYELIKGRGLAVYRDAGVRLAISRTIAIETPRGWRIAKEKAAHKIDVVVALAMACHAAVQGSRIPEELNIHPVIWGGVPRNVPGAIRLSWARWFVRRGLERGRPRRSQVRRHRLWICERRAGTPRAARAASK
jgi:Phage Terminase